MDNSFVRAVLHMKACLLALGSSDALHAAVEAGYTDVVIAAGQDGEYLDAIGDARRLGLAVLSVALPKIRGLSANERTTLSATIARAVSAGAPAVSVMLADERMPGDDRQRHEVSEWLNSIGVPLYLENSGGPGEWLSHIPELHRLIESVDGARAIVDVGHLVSSHAGEADVSAIMSRVAFVDVHDNDGLQDLHWPLGRGRGAGSFVTGLRRLPSLPPHIVIETDPRLGPDTHAWIDALRRDRHELSAALAPARRAAAGSVHS